MLIFIFHSVLKLVFAQTVSTYTASAIMQHSVSINRFIYMNINIIVQSFVCISPYGTQSVGDMWYQVFTNNVTVETQVKCVQQVEMH